MKPPEVHTEVHTEPQTAGPAEDPAPTHGEEPLFVGIHGDKESVHVAVARRDGGLVAEAAGPGISPGIGAGLSGTPNPDASELAAVLTSVFAAALKGVKDLGAIEGGLAGLAGTPAETQLLQQAADRAWEGSGLAGAIRVVPTLVTAFWSGLDQCGDKEALPQGTVLIAGSTAVAAEVRGADLGAVADGYGHLLGDAGSSAWLGRQVVRAALDGDSGRGPATLLTDLVLAGRSSSDVIAGVYSHPPHDLGKYAPLVDQAYGVGDQVAFTIATKAAEELLATVDSLPGQDRLVVLVGAVATGDGPVGELLRAGLVQQGRELRVGGSCAFGAALLAACS